MGQGRCNREVKFCEKFKTKIVGEVGGVSVGGQGGCERIFFFFWGGGGGGVGFGMFWLGVFGLGGQGGCERRIEVFVKIKRKTFVGGSGWGVRSGGGVGSGWGVRGDVNEELKFFRKFTKTNREVNFREN